MHIPDIILCVWATSESSFVSFSSGVQASKVIFAVLWSLARSLIPVTHPVRQHKLVLFRLCGLIPLTDFPPA